MRRTDIAVIPVIKYSIFWFVTYYAYSKLKGLTKIRIFYYRMTIYYTDLQKHNTNI